MPARAAKTGDPDTREGRLRIARVGAELSARELAQRVGVGEQSIYDYESPIKTSSPNPRVLARIAAATGRKLDWLLNGGEEDEPSTSERVAGIALLLDEDDRRALLALAEYYLAVKRERAQRRGEAVRQRRALDAAAEIKTAFGPEKGEVPEDRNQDLPTEAESP